MGWKYRPYYVCDRCGKEGLTGFLSFDHHINDVSAKVLDQDLTLDFSVYFYKKTGGSFVLCEECLQETKEELANAIKGFCDLYIIELFEQIK